MKILILGVASPQAELIQLLSKQHEVHAASYRPEGKGIRHAHVFKQIDIKDEQKVYEYARDERIDLVYSVGSDLGMVTAARVSHRLNLPSFVSPETATVCHTKDLMRMRFESFDWNIEARTFSDASDLQGFAYPFIIKPVDSQGQRGVFLIHNYQELAEKIPISLSYSQAKRLIAEEFVRGPEISVNAYVVNGKIGFSLISDRIVWPDFPGGLIHKHRYPSRFATGVSEARTHQLVSEAIANLGIQNGPAYFQIKLAGGAPELIEMTPRLDGCHLWRLIKYATGTDLLQATIRHLMGELPELRKVPDLQASWTLEFMCDRPDELLDIGKYDTSDAQYVEWYYENGDKIKRVNSGMEKCGFKIFREEPQPHPEY